MPCVSLSEGDGERAINIGSLPGGGNNHFPPAILVAIGHDGAGGGGAAPLDSLPKRKDVHYLGGTAGASPKVTSRLKNTLDRIGCPMNAIDGYISVLRIACFGGIGYLLTGRIGGAEIDQVASLLRDSHGWASAIGGRVNSLALIGNDHRVAGVADSSRCKRNVASGQQQSGEQG